jgi:hypothetical protein
VSCTILTAILVGLGTGLTSDRHTVAVPLVHAAACKNPNQTCTHPDLTKTSVLDVAHAKSYGEYVVPVEPDTGESWSITAYWNTEDVPCAERSETATVDVDWTGSSWALSNKSLATNIVDIGLCPLASLSCTSVGSHSGGYRLVVDVRDPAVAIYNLRQVVYTTTSVDDGYLLNLASCTLGSDVSPTSQSFSQTDSGSFECELTCSTITGPSLTIAYQ